MKKSASMGNLSSAHHLSFSSSPNAGGSPSSDPLCDPTHVADCYASDDIAHASCSSSCCGKRKKGTPWTEEKHWMFLVSLQKLGKGDWRGIARNFVVFRALTQIASHAQKYFIRQSNTSRRKRRSSLFDMVLNVPVDQLPVLDEQFPTESSQASEAESTNRPPPLNLSLNLDCKPMESPSDETPLEAEEPNVSSILSPVMVPTFFPTYVPFPPFPAQPQNLKPAGEEKTETHKVLKLIPIFPKDPVNGNGLATGVLHIHLMTVRSIGRVANVEPDELYEIGHLLW